MKKIIIMIIILVLIGIIGLFVFQSSNSAGNIANNVGNIQQNQNEQNVVEITSNGFSPSVLTINVGETITWINKYASPSWPASNVHPIHKSYPGSDISKCGTDELIFDTCRNLKQGESFSFTFNEKGSWKYHDHLSPGTGGTIIVK